MKQVMILLVSIAGCLLFVLTGCVQVEMPREVYVDDDFNASVTGWGHDHFRSIQDAINAVDTNGRIVINAGTYEGPIVFDRPGQYEIMGADVWTTIISGKTDEESVILVESMVQINISGITIQGNATDKKSTCYDAGILLQSVNNSISGNRFLGHCCGIYTEYAVDNRIVDNLFQDNYHGILFYTGSNTNLVEGNVFFDNQIGCKFKGSSENRVNGNLFSSNVGGVYLCCLSTDNVFEGNVFKENTEFHAQDWCLNRWNETFGGNFWDDFYRDDQQAFDEDDDGFVDEEYVISRGYQPEELPNRDYLPLRSEPLVENGFVDSS